MVDVMTFLKAVWFLKVPWFTAHTHPSHMLTLCNHISSPPPVFWAIERDLVEEMLGKQELEDSACHTDPQSDRLGTWQRSL